MPQLRDLTGQTFGYLTVLHRAPNQGDYVCWVAKCTCGVEVIKQARDLTGNKRGSCGCMSNALRSASSPHATHRLTKTPTYKSWSMMKSRCTNPNYTHHEYYGGRGIKVCQSWLDSFENFLADMGVRPKGTTLDRIDSDGDYTPDNCRWSTSAIQSDNKTTSLAYLYNGEMLSLNAIAKRTGTKRSKLYAYMYRGYSLELAILFSR